MISHPTVSNSLSEHGGKVDCSHHAPLSSNAPAVPLVSPEQASVTLSMTVSISQACEALRQSNLNFPFPWKLLRLLEDTETGCHNDIVSWLPDGKGFKIHKENDFRKKILSEYFNQAKLKSFTRQLYLYGFIKVLAGVNEGAYIHPQFVRGDRESCLSIRRNQNKGDRRQTKRARKDLWLAESKYRKKKTIATAGAGHIPTPKTKTAGQSKRPTASALLFDQALSLTVSKRHPSSMSIAPPTEKSPSPVNSLTPKQTEIPAANTQEANGDAGEKGIHTGADPNPKCGGSVTRESELQTGSKLEGEAWSLTGSKRHRSVVSPISPTPQASPEANKSHHVDLSRMGENKAVVASSQEDDDLLQVCMMVAPVSRESVTNWLETHPLLKSTANLVPNTQDLSDSGSDEVSPSVEDWATLFEPNLGPNQETQSFVTGMSSATEANHLPPCPIEGLMMTEGLLPISVHDSKTVEMHSSCGLPKQPTR